MPDQLFVQEDLWKCGSIVDAFLISASDEAKCKLKVRAVSPSSNEPRVNTLERLAKTHGSLGHRRKGLCVSVQPNTDFSVVSLQISRYRNWPITVH